MFELWPNCHKLLTYGIILWRFERPYIKRFIGLPFKEKREFLRSYDQRAIGSSHETFFYEESRDPMSKES